MAGDGWIGWRFVFAVEEAFKGNVLTEIICYL
jgi:hypothetical protein